MEPLAWVSAVFVLVIGGGLSAIIWWSLQRGRRVRASATVVVPTLSPSATVATAIVARPERGLDQCLEEQSGTACVLIGSVLTATKKSQLFQAVEPMTSFRVLFVLQERGYREASRAELLDYLEHLVKVKNCPVGRIFAIRLLSATVAEIEQMAGESGDKRFSYRLSQVLPDLQQDGASSFVTLSPGDYVLGIENVPKT